MHVPSRSHSPAPGLLVCAAAAAVSVGINQVWPVVSALLVAILLGVLVGNVMPQPAAWQPGTAFAAKKLLRAGIVVLGLKISLADIAGLGWPVVLLVVAVVAVGIVGSYALGRALGVEPEASMLVAGGFSICGAAAVAAVDGAIGAKKKEDVATAVALVVLFGTIMIGLVPAIAVAAGLPPQVAAVWAGAGTHEVAQVVAIGGILGGGSLLATAVVVKLARVVLLAPATVAIGVWARRRAGVEGERPPLVQGFVVGFLIAVLIRTFIPLPPVALRTADIVQTVLLAMAMFALGLGVNRKALAQASGRALALGVGSTVLVNAIAFGGAWATFALAH